MEQRLTRHGSTIGYLADGVGSDGRRRVLDRNHRLVGWISDRGTWDQHQRKLADWPDAGLLLDR